MIKAVGDKRTAAAAGRNIECNICIPDTEKQGRHPGSSTSDSLEAVNYCQTPRIQRALHQPSPLHQRDAIMLGYPTPSISSAITSVASAGATSARVWMRLIRSAGEGRVGACGDNAAMESFFALLQKNVLNRKRWETREELHLAIVVWLEKTYHRRRRQVGLGRLTPIEFETIYSAALAA